MVQQETFNTSLQRIAYKERGLRRCAQPLCVPQIKHYPLKRTELTSLKHMQHPWEDATCNRDCSNRQGARHHYQNAGQHLQINHAHTEVKTE